MNAFILHTTIVYLVIAGGVKCTNANFEAGKNDIPLNTYTEPTALDYKDIMKAACATTGRTFKSKIIQVFICEHKDYLNEDDFKCLIERTPTIDKCFEALDKNEFSTASISGEAYSDKLLRVLKLNQTQCNKFHKLRSCIVNDLGHCNRSMIAHVFDNLFELGLRLTTCSEIKAASEADKSTTVETTTEAKKKFYGLGQGTYFIKKPKALNN